MWWDFVTVSTVDDTRYEMNVNIVVVVTACTHNFWMMRLLQQQHQLQKKRKHATWIALNDIYIYREICFIYATMITTLQEGIYVFVCVSDCVLLSRLLTKSLYTSAMCAVWLSAGFTINQSELNDSNFHIYIYTRPTTINYLSLKCKHPCHYNPRTQFIAHFVFVESDAVWTAELRALILVNPLIIVAMKVINIIKLDFIHRSLCWDVWKYTHKICIIS